MTDALRDATVPRTATIREALRAVDRGAGGIALVIEPDGRLAGLATDGDLRRALLAGASLDGPVESAFNREFVALRTEDSRVDALDLMRARRIDAIPVLDDAGRPVALHLLHAFLEPTSRANWAVVMAGGRGERLGPLTESVPKPMLRVAGRPILERLVLHLVGFGVTRIFISVGYLAEVIEAHFGDGAAFGATIEYLREDRPLGTGGALGLLPGPPDRALLVLNGDLVTTVDVGRMLEVHAARGFAATIGTRRYVHTVPFGCIERDGDRVVAMEEKPVVTRDVNAGIYALEPWVVGLVAPGVATTMPEVIEAVLARGEAVGTFEVDGDWVDVGHRDQLAHARGGG